jgi:hypothetical protein
MPIAGRGWELHVMRTREERVGNSSTRRTAGVYQVFHDGVAVAGEAFVGTIAEAKGPGANRPAKNGQRIEEGTYPLSTHHGSNLPGSSSPKYITIGYNKLVPAGGAKRPSLRLLKTDQREGILIHPGNKYLSSTGCLNPCKVLFNSSTQIDWVDSRDRMVAILEDLKAFAGPRFPRNNNEAIPDAFLVIDGEP